MITKDGKFKLPIIVNPAKVYDMSNRRRRLEIVSCYNFRSLLIITGNWLLAVDEKL